MDNDSLDRLLKNYTALITRIDGHIHHLEEKYPDNIVCKKGCDACCRFLTLFPVEALAVSRAFIHLSQKSRDRIVKRLKDKQKDACPLLIDRSCAVYSARPIICRTHGYPICIEKNGETRIDFCPENFKGVLSFPRETLLSVEQLNTTLIAVNQHFLDAIETDAPFPERIPVSEAIFLLS